MTDDWNKSLAEALELANRRLKDVVARTVYEWDEDNLSLTALAYDPADEVCREFVHSFKATRLDKGPTWSWIVALALLTKCLKTYEVLIRDEHQCRFLVAVPSHEAGWASSCSLYLCGMLAESFSFLKHVPDALCRTASIRSAHTRLPGDRPTLSEHLRTITYSGPSISEEKKLLLFDDVITQGTSSQACIQRIMDATHCRHEDIVRLFLGRTRRL